MKINFEQALDMLPIISDIYVKLDLKKYALDNSKDKIKTELGLDMIFKHVLKQSKTIKKELIELAAIALEKDIEEVKKESVFVIINVVKEIYKDVALVDFFGSAVQ